VSISRHKDSVVGCRSLLVGAKPTHTCVTVPSDIPFVIVTSFGVLTCLAWQQNVVLCSINQTRVHFNYDVACDIGAVACG
jgi:hypothetical protein